MPPCVFVDYGTTEVNALVCTNFVQVRVANFTWQECGFFVCSVEFSSKVIQVTGVELMPSALLAMVWCWAYAASTPLHVARGDCTAAVPLVRTGRLENIHCIQRWTARCLRLGMFSSGSRALKPPVSTTPSIVNTAGILRSLLV